MRRRFQSRDKTPEEMIEQGLQKLRECKRAQQWVCREVLGLPPGPTKEMIVNRVHAAIHTANAQQRNDEEIPVSGIAAIIAGAQLLRGW